MSEVHPPHLRLRQDVCLPCLPKKYHQDDCKILRYRTIYILEFIWYKYESYIQLEVISEQWYSGKFESEGALAQHCIKMPLLCHQKLEGFFEEVRGRRAPAPIHHCLRVRKVALVAQVYWRCGCSSIISLFIQPRLGDPLAPPSSVKFKSPPPLSS